jgi:hypothetical protein
MAKGGSLSPAACGHVKLFSRFRPQFLVGDASRFHKREEVRRCVMGAVHRSTQID